MPELIYEVWACQPIMLRNQTHMMPNNHKFLSDNEADIHQN